MARDVPARDGVGTPRGGARAMEWTKPSFVEISMDTEIGRYQEDDGDRR
jgi:hypothetical protein